jgi:hypothetical protein
MQNYTFYFKKKGPLSINVFFASKRRKNGVYTERFIFYYRIECSYFIALHGRWETQKLYAAQRSCLRVAHVCSRLKSKFRAMLIRGGT